MGFKGTKSINIDESSVYQSPTAWPSIILRDSSGYKLAHLYSPSLEVLNANALLIKNAFQLLEMVEILSENLELQLSMRGCCMHGDDKDRKADADSYGGNDLLKLARELIIKTTNI